MKVNIVLLIIFSLFNSIKISALEIHVQKIVKIKSNDKVELYSATISINNNTDKTISFWAMTCSWQGNWITCNDSIGIAGGKDCDSNFSYLIELKPNQSKKYECTIVRNCDKKNKKTKGYKIGLVLIKEKEYSLMQSEFFDKIVNRKINKKKDIIWSFPFELY